MKTRPILLSVLAAVTLVFANQDIQSASPTVTPEMEIRALKRQVSSLEAKLAAMEARLKKLEARPTTSVITPGVGTLFSPNVLPQVTIQPPVIHTPGAGQHPRTVNGQTFYSYPLTR